MSTPYLSQAPRTVTEVVTAQLQAAFRSNAKDQIKMLLAIKAIVECKNNA